MEDVLVAIGKQANFDRILFTPALKKIYFEMAMGSGGATMFKHADSVRSGLSFIADKAGDDKHALLFCEAQELIHGYGLLYKLAAQLTPVVVLALKHTPPEETRQNWSFMQLAGTGWMQFHTHTLQELYDHLALAFHGIEEKKTMLPIIILHSAVKHDSACEWKAHEDINMGNPLTGLQSKRAGKPKDFAEALAALKKKEAPPSLQSTYEKLIPTLRAIYTTLEYSLPDDGLPYAGSISKADRAVVTLIPPHDESQVADSTDTDWIRPLCYRPFAYSNLILELQQKKTVAVVEPRPSSGIPIPPFFAEIKSMLDNKAACEVVSVTMANHTSTLSKSHIETIESYVSKPESNCRFPFLEIQ